MKATRNIIVAVVAGVVVVAAIAASGWGGNGGGPAAQTSAVTPVAVEVTQVKPSNLTSTVAAVGSIAATRDVVVSSETAGRVVRVLVKVGDAVRQGQPLVLVDDEMKAIAVDQAKAQLQAAETNAGKADNDYKRAQKLFGTGDIADIELEGNRLAFHSAEAQRASALAALRYAQRQLDDTRIKSPIAGYVASRKIEVGEMASPGREIANIVDVSRLKVKLSIPEESIGAIRLRQRAILRIDSNPEKPITGEVYSVGTKSESPTGHTYPVEVVVANVAPGVLKVGMFARVEILAGSAANALSISKESLVSEESNPAVFVVDGTTARLRPVKLGLRTGDRLQVVEGLKEGELVISFGQKNVKDGAPVRYK
jgi:membrane fusion protein (multidrug efflux system)